jgi:hypothetical protein
VIEDARAFFRRMRLEEHFSRKDTNIDISSQATETSELERINNTIIFFFTLLD